MLQNYFKLDEHGTNVKTEVLDANPDIAELFAPIAEALDDETMVDLNAQVDVDGDDPEDVAREWLDDNPVDDSIDLSGVSVTVGSKEFTEQLILGYITKFALEDAGAEVGDQIGIMVDVNQGWSRAQGPRRQIP